jgi:hypothetical protein
MTPYPDSFDNLDISKLNSTPTFDDHPAHHNAIAGSVNAVQGVLGLNPEGDFDTVRGRLEAIEDDIVEVASLVKVGNFLPPGFTGNHTVSGLGFRPIFVEFEVLHGDSTSFASMARGAMDKDGNQWAYAINAPGSGSDAQRQFVTNRCMLRISGTATLQIRASFVSMNTNGFTVNFDNTSADGRILWKAIGRV